MLQVIKNRKVSAESTTEVPAVLVNEMLLIHN